MFGFLISLIFAASGFIGPALASSGSPVWAYLTPFLALGLIPVLDLVLPRDTVPASKGPSAFFDGILVIYAGMHVALILWGSWMASLPDTDTPRFVGLILSVGLVTGAIGLSFAHELIHRQSRFHRALAELILIFVGFGHFAVAHVYGHHRHVATPEDPVTARKGQSLYAYFLRAVPGVFLCSWRLRRRRTLVYLGLSLLCASAIYWWLGVWALAFFAGQSLMAILLTETADYIEHYGLERKLLSEGRYEAVAAHHSWDSDRWLTGKLMVHLQRHSDHHLHAAKKYHELELIANPRQLPTGYAGCLLIALIPPLWRRMMDHRI